MNRWESLYLIVYWNGPGTEAILVYSNGCKVETLCGAEKTRVQDYLNGLKSQGWEKFGRERPNGDLRETYYFQRPLAEPGRNPDRGATIPMPQFVQHRI